MEERLPKGTLGGQAVIEGVMMKGPGGYSVAVRKPDKKIEVKLVRHRSYGDKHPMHLFVCPCRGWKFRIPFPHHLSVKTVFHFQKEHLPICIGGQADKGFRFRFFCFQMFAGLRRFQALP